MCYLLIEGNVFDTSCGKHCWSNKGWKMSAIFTESLPYRKTEKLLDYLLIIIIHYKMHFKSETAISLRSDNYFLINVNIAFDWYLNKINI